MNVLVKGPTTDPTAYDLYLKGLYLSRQAGKEPLEAAIRCFESATKKDPKFALAYAGCAEAYILGGAVFFPRAEFYPRAKELATRALELDPNSSEAHMVRANLAMQGDLDWKLAESEFKKAIALNPGNADAHFWYATLLAALQRYDESRDELRETLRLAPNNANAWSWLAMVHSFAGDVYAATTLSEELRERDPNEYFSRVLTTYNYVTEGRTADALKEAERLVNPPDLWGRLNRAGLYAMLGRPEEAGRILRELEVRSKTEYVPLGWIAAIQAVLGDKEKATELLERDLREGDKAFWFLYQAMFFDPLRNEPRFTALLRSYNLPTTTPNRILTLPHVEEETRHREAVPT
jgi:eukaryotic-like serine/threonine-protein kinase